MLHLYLPTNLHMPHLSPLKWLSSFLLLWLTLLFLTAMIWWTSSPFCPKISPSSLSSKNSWTW